ncbi:MAG: MerR family transcriptional regulator [Rickettsiales bacterium]|jgi:DNA-binding transcriptional MerR regulator|nr:MerR family transcriptional regulator [Rickettsiales bacterium]
MVQTESLPDSSIKADNGARQELAVEKSEHAFRTISEVADSLGVPQHVLRFWETRFPQIKPLKMRGGRRYYRPEDIALITTIKDLLYRQGFTIDGAKKAIGKDLPLAIGAPAGSSLTDKQLDQLTVVRQELITLKELLKRQLY